jgi:hypothetical protein
MSQIGECPRVLYDQLVMPSKVRPTGKERLFALDKELKQGVRDRIRAAGLLEIWETREITAQLAGFQEPRLRGHLDGEFSDGVLLHIKPCRVEILDGIRSDEHHRIPKRHFEQMQVYMRHAEYDKVRAVYVARETGELWLSEIRADMRTQDRLDAKACGVLMAADQHKPPQCTCNKCEVPTLAPAHLLNRPLNPTAAPKPSSVTETKTAAPNAYDRFRFLRQRK